ncbi:MAG: GDSL-type esterase/lipase family protein [Mycobacteriales bacterium]
MRMFPIPALVPVLAVLLAATVPPPGARGGAPHRPFWTQAWGAAVQPPVAGTEDTGPNWSVDGFADQTVRQVVRLSTGGGAVRVELSNRYGRAPLRVAAATVGLSAGGAAVRPGTLRPLRWSGPVPPGRTGASDPVALPVVPGDELVVTLRFAGPTGPATFHRFTTATSYRAAGDHVADPGGAAFTGSTASWYYLTGVDVTGSPDTIVAVGDSVTDGVGSSPGDHRYTDDLAARLAAAGRPRGVADAGIAGGKLLNDSTCYGERGTARFRRDVLDRPGVRAVVLELGLNDLGAPQQVGDPCALPAPLVGAERIIAAYQELIGAAHARGIAVVGATMIPIKGALFPFYSPRAARVRQQVNHWIRTGGAFDAVADFDRAMADPADPEQSRRDLVSVDGAHPNDAGYRALAATFDLDRW